MEQIKKTNPPTRRTLERNGKVNATRGGNIRDFKTRSVNIEEVNFQGEQQQLGFVGQLAIESNPLGLGTPALGDTNEAVVFTDLGTLPKFVFRSSVYPALDNFYNNGDASFAWARLYAYSFPAPSDARIKNTVESIKYGLDTINKLRPVSYKYNGTENTRLGFIAQEVKKEIPETVEGSDETRYSLSYDEIIPVLVKSVQELSARVKELEDNVV